MRFKNLEISGLVLVELDLKSDDRGFFVERFKESDFLRAGLPTRFQQINHSRSAPGVLRGLHYQHTPPQGKLVGVTRGRIWDVAVDIRKESPSFGRHIGVELSDLNGRLLWIPAGFAHGFCVLGKEPADVVYQVDAAFSSEGEGSLRWNDPKLAIAWPLDQMAAGAPILSARDQNSPAFT